MERGRGWRPCLGLGAGALLVAMACGPAEVAETPRAALARASAVMGSGDALPTRGPLVLHASGTLDKWAEGQGHAPDASSPGPLVERLALELGPGGAALRSYREDRFDGTWEAFGELYAADTLQTLLLPGPGIALRFRGPGFADERRAIRRRLPHLLVMELGARPEALAWMDEPATLSGRLADGTRVLLTLDPETGLPREVAWRQRLPGRGPTTLRWRWAEWRDAAAGLRLPYRWTATVGERPLAELAVDSVELEAEGAFALPEDLTLLPVRPAPDQDAEPEALVVEPLAPSLWRVPGVRSGFAPLVAEMDSFLAVVDAPASFPLLGGIPAGETDPGPSMSHPSERLLDLLSRSFPDKPVRHLVLTHHHEDHVGGVRPFVAAGATVHGSAESLQVARRLAELPSSAVDDRLAREPAPFRGEVVEERRALGSGPGRLELLPVGENPHARGMLVVRLPGAGGALFVSDLATPAPLEQYPAGSHATLDRFLARWLEARGLTPDTVWAMHGSGVLTPAHLASLRED